MLRLMWWMTATLTLILGPLPSTHGQEQPDFSGTWVVENVESQAPQDNAGARRGGRGGGGQPGGGMRGGGRGGDRGPGGRGGGRQGRGAMVGEAYQTGDRVTLEQTADALIVTDERRSVMSRYPFDGQETSNPDPGASTVTSRTRWEGAALLTESDQTFDGPRGAMTIEIRVVRSLSADGKTMTVVTRREMPFGTMSSTVTFAPVDDAR